MGHQLKPKLENKGKRLGCGPIGVREKLERMGRGMMEYIVCMCIVRKKKKNTINQRKPKQKEIGLFGCFYSNNELSFQSVMVFSSHLLEEVMKYILWTLGPHWTYTRMNRPMVISSCIQTSALHWVSRPSSQRWDDSNTEGRELGPRCTCLRVQDEVECL